MVFHRLPYLEAFSRETTTVQRDAAYPTHILHSTHAAHFVSRNSSVAGLVGMQSYYLPTLPESTVCPRFKAQYGVCREYDTQKGTKHVESTVKEHQSVEEGPNRAVCFPA